MAIDNDSLLSDRRGYLKGLAAASALLWGGTGTATAWDNEKSNGDHHSDGDVNFDIHYTSATTLAVLIRTGDVSPVDLVDATLKRLNNREDATNMFITVTGKRARKAAKDAEHAVENGDELGPLHGVPIAVKDLQAVKGVRWTSGAAPLSDRVADETELVVKRLFDAGAILIGKTNTPEFGYTGKCDNKLIGPTSTPFDLDRNSGGSSGGSASAVASGVVSIGTGTDGAGSLRIPASFCSTYGFKTTFRRLPDPVVFRTGTTYKDNGVETRTVRDAALALSIMAGPSDVPQDQLVLPDCDMDFLGAVEKGVKDMKVGYSPDLGVYPVDDRVQNVVGENVDAIADAGATVERIDVDLGVKYDKLMHSLRIMWGEAYCTLPEKLAEHDIDMLGDDRDKFPNELLDFVEFGRDELSTVALKRNDETVRKTVFNAVQSIFEDGYDILVAPTVAVPPIPNDVVGPTEINGTEIDPILGWLITAVFNMTGNPAASVPAGLTDDKELPVGMQLVGKRLADETVLAASAAYERVNPWHDDYPKQIQSPNTETSQTSSNTKDGGNGKAKRGDNSSLAKSM
ncbi:amidase [Halococcus thailandensis]|uniref:Glutamyl-tRNA amidotransferase subunit A n=1 Tax=Halococcus thailandensis JCM 13552 TaxID=1227457 RepID=M0NG31_9EURY|nr:amidase [Halococcus thailandensis]EMA56493.1 glutamyl-tRNA amidotransferase subunit A [Halococcus thailandensis JCM 13552]